MEADSDDEDFRPVLSLKKSKPKKSHSYRNKMENWENAEVSQETLCWSILYVACMI